jgi:two-component system, cell cycle sensor histidine kinase and response regulator CckA
MAIPINVLVVEDSDDDTLLMMRELRQHGYEPLHRRVETAQDLRLAIEQRAWDVVVSDHNMPRFNGSEALEIFKGLKLNIPFIFVSGTHGEEAAVHMMKAGANDYIVKGQLSRLVPAIEREMESARSRRAQRRAEDAMHHLAAIVTSTEDAIYSVNLDGAIISWNFAAEKIYGYRADEIIGRSIAILFPSSRRDELLESMAQIRRGELVGICETERLRKDGRIISICLTISPIKNAGDKIIGTSVIARDISKQKQEEQDRLKLITELTAALRQVQTLTGLLPICASCKRIRDDDDNWMKIETYVARTSRAVFTHGICPECSEKFEAGAVKNA